MKRALVAALLFVIMLAGLLRVPAFARDGYPDSHVIAERLAHDYVYALGQGIAGKDAMKKDKAGRDLIEMGKGFEILDTIDDPDVAGGFAAMAVRDRKTGLVYIVFRGTDSKEDAKQDYASLKRLQAEVGKNQFEHFQKRLEKWVDDYSKEGKVIVTGHSLGGAIAQRLTASKAGRISEMVIFQSPAVEEAVAAQFDNHPGPKPKTTLYVAEYDVVSDFGARHVASEDGEVVVAHIEGVEGGGVSTERRRENYLKSHGALMLQAAGATGLRREEGKVWRYDRYGRVTLKKLTSKEYASLRGLAGGDALAKAEGKGTPVIVTVTDAATHDAVGGATVTVSGGDRAGRRMTDGRGVVTLNLPYLPGGQRVFISAKKEGYEDASATIYPDPGPINKNLSLKPLMALSLKGPLKVRSGDESTYNAVAAAKPPSPAFEWYLDGQKQAARSGIISISWVKPGNRVVKAVLLAQGKVLCEKSITVLVEARPLNVRIKGSGKGKVGKRSEYSASIEGGMEPYTYAWALDGVKQAITGDTIGITWKAPGKGFLELTVIDHGKTSGTDRIPIEVTGDEKTANLAGGPAPVPSTAVSQSGPSPSGKSGVWVLVDTKIYTVPGSKVTHSTADLDRTLYSFHGAWTPPPAQMIPGQILTFRMAVSFSERSTEHGRYIGATVSMDQEKVGVAPGYANTSRIIIGSVKCEYDPGTLNESGNARYKVPEGRRGDTFQIRCMLGDGVAPVPGACFIYEYR